MPLRAIRPPPSILTPNYARRLCAQAVRFLPPSFNRCSRESSSSGNSEASISAPRVSLDFRSEKCAPICHKQRTPIHLVNGEEGERRVTNYFPSKSVMFFFSLSRAGYRDNTAERLVSEQSYDAFSAEQPCESRLARIKPPDAKYRPRYSVTREGDTTRPRARAVFIFFRKYYRAFG